MQSSEAWPVLPTLKKMHCMYDTGNCVEQKLIPKYRIPREANIWGQSTTQVIPTPNWINSDLYSAKLA